MAIRDYPQRLTLENRLEELDKINPWLEKAWIDFKLSDEHRFETALCIYEAVANVVMYAYQEPDGYSIPPEPVVRNIEVSLILHQEAIEITIKDDGYPFNPLTTPEKKVAQTITEAALSGRGIPLLRGLSDNLTYHRAGGYNCLSIMRSFEQRKSMHR